MNEEDISRSARELEDRPAREVLVWAAAQFPGRVTFAMSLGMEDCIVADMIARSRLSIDLFTIDTGLLFPETYTLWADLEERYGVRIRRVSPPASVDEQAAIEGPELWTRDPDRCCDLRKIQPLRSMLATYDSWVTAIRRDQTTSRANAPIVSRDGRFGLVKINPLARWTFDDVKAYASEHNVPCNPLHDRNYPSISCMPCTSAVLPGEDPRSGRWRGSEKTECGLHWVKVKS